MMATRQSSCVLCTVSARAQERLAAGLAMIAGYVDAFGYITSDVLVIHEREHHARRYTTGHGHLRRRCLAAGDRVLR